MMVIRPAGLIDFYSFLSQGVNSFTVLKIVFKIKKYKNLCVLCGEISYGSERLRTTF
jgi:hypothetical protein